MKQRNISIRYKIFLLFFGFAIVLLLVLWFFQIIYLNDFYKLIKKNEAELILHQVEDLLSESEDPTDDIEKIAAGSNVAILVTDKDGALIYNAEYIINSRMSSIPKRLFQIFYDEANENGGEAVIEFKGSERQFEDDLKRLKEQIPPPDETFGSQEKDGRLSYTLPENPDDIAEDFKQNIGNEMAESVVYFKIFNDGTNEYAIMVNSVLTPLDTTVSTLKSELVIISIIIVVIAFLVSLFFSRSISKSIIKTNAGAQRLADGDYSVKFDSHDYLEIAQLSDTLNYAVQELSKADELQKELIANVSHDLRTPLTMIKGYSEVMRDIPGENTPENVQVVIDETERLAGLVNDMLDISKLKAGTITLEPKEYNFTESVIDVLNRYNKLREAEGYIIDFEYDEQVFVNADEQKMYQVIYNLINNAINYTGNDKKVTVVQRVFDKYLRIEVTDTGKGVAQEDIPYVWDRYYKDKSAHKRAIMGTGLGLSIVKSVLELHGAKYGVFSKRGEGATFWFEIPLNPFLEDEDEEEE